MLRGRETHQIEKTVAAADDLAGADDAVLKVAGRSVYCRTMNLGNAGRVAVLRSLCDAFTLKEVEHRVAAYPQSALELLRRWMRAARERETAAQALSEAHAPSAAALYRQSVLCYLAAFLTSRSCGPLPGEPLVPDDLLARMRNLRVQEGLSLAFDDNELARFFELTGGEDLMAVDRLDRHSASEIVALGQKMVRALGTLVDPRTVSEVRFERGVRLAVAGIVVLVVAAFAIAALRDRGNVALHKPTTTSSVHPRAVMAPGGLTDGITTESYGIHTDVEDFPWVQVDLQATYKISRVVVYNRGDAEFDAGLPFTLQLSEDGIHYVDVETRTTSFGQWIPWVAFCHDRKARYVRVHSAKGKYVALSEVKVFGRAI